MSNNKVGLEFTPLGNKETGAVYVTQINQQEENFQDGSGVIIAANTAQTALSANPSRRGFLIQNVSEATLWFDTLHVATLSQPSFKLTAGSSYESVTGDGGGALSVIGGVVGQEFSVRSW